MRTKKGINDLIKDILIEGSVNVTSLDKIADQIIEALKGAKLLLIPGAVRRSEQLFCSMAGEGFCPYEGKDGKCTMLDKCVNHTTK